MDISPQNVYAKCLPSHRGYPLRRPEPSSTLPTIYKEDGLQIGDVGFVNHEGIFIVLFNITHERHHAINQRRPDGYFGFDPIELDIERDLDVQSNADPRDCVIISPGITHHIRTPQRGHYEFSPSSEKGAILILHDGSTSHNLFANERFRELAVKHASDWYEVAKRDYGDSISNGSLYLITGFRKTRSWSLASFYDPTAARGQRIKLLPREGKDATAGRDWQCTFPVDYRDGLSLGSDNQTVFISGFKIAIRDDVLRWFTDAKPEVHAVPTAPKHQRLFTRFLMRLLCRGDALNRHHKANDSAEVVHTPALSPPFHPSDFINEYMLNKDPNALVAVTHDNEWMSLIESGEITSEELMQKGYLEEFLSAKYSLVSDPKDMSVYLTIQSKGVGESAQTGVQQNSRSEECWYNKPSANNHVVITRIRAEDLTVGMSRIPVGFYVLIQFDGSKRRTENKPVRLNDNVLEWDTCIQLPSEPSTVVRLSVCGSFEFLPMLGDGEILCKTEIHVEDLLRGGHLITFSPTEGGLALPCSSIFISAEQRGSGQPAAVNGDDNFYWEESSELAQVTNQGHNALLHYRDHPTNENITASIEYFQRALNICPPGHQCRASVLCNFAFACFSGYRVGSSPTSLSTCISYYREALNLRDAGHPDRPGTLLRLAQALLYHYEKQDGEESNLGGIMDLATEVQKICAADSHERRAADLVLQTCDLFKAASTGNLADASGLIPVLREVVQDAPHNYFDRLQRLANLALALGSRYHLSGDPKDLNEPIMIYEEAMQLIPRTESPFHLLPLREWAKLKLITSSWKDTLVVATSFMIPRFRIYQVICDRLEETSRVVDALACLHQLCNEVTQEMVDEQVRSWIEDFRSRCRRKLVYLGAMATQQMHLRRYSQSFHNRQTQRFASDLATFSS